MSKTAKSDFSPKRALLSRVPEISGPIIRACGNRELSVDGCRGVKDCFDNRITLSVSGGMLTVTGDDLRITSFTDSSAVITGYILNIEFTVGVLGK